MILNSGDGGVLENRELGKQVGENFADNFVFIVTEGLVGTDNFGVGCEVGVDVILALEEEDPLSLSRSFLEEDLGIGFELELILEVFGVFCFCEFPLSLCDEEGVLGVQVVEKLGLVVLPGLEFEGLDFEERYFL